MKSEYYSYEYWYDRFYNKENAASLAKQEIANISFEQYVAYFFVSELPDGGDIYHPDFDKNLEEETRKCDRKLKFVLLKGINTTLSQIMQLAVKKKSDHNINLN